MPPPEIPPPLPPRPTPASDWRAGGDRTLLLVFLGCGASSVLLTVWVVYIAYEDSLAFGNPAPRTWLTTILRWYPVLVLGCSGAGLGLWSLARRLGVRSRLAALVPISVAALPTVLLLAGWFRPAQPLDRLEFATRAERRLALAARAGDLEALDRALREGVSPSTRAAHGPSVLRLAIDGRHHAAFLRLLEAGADPAVGGAGVDDPVSAPALRSDTFSPPASEWLGPLLDHGLPVAWNGKDLGGPLLERFAARDDEASVRLLLERGADPTLRWRQDRLTPFCGSVKDGRFRAALVLLPRAPRAELECADFELNGKPHEATEASRAFDAQLQARLHRTRVR